MRRCLFLATALVTSSVAAHADSLSTFDVNSRFQGGSVGTMTLDTTTGVIMDANLTVSSTMAFGAVTFTGAPQQQGYSNGEYYANFLTSSSFDSQAQQNVLELNIPFSTPGDSLADYMGTENCTMEAGGDGCGSSTYSIFSGSNHLDEETDYGEYVLSGEQANVLPEPPSVVLLGTGLLALIGVGFHRFTSRRSA